MNIFEMELPKRKKFIDLDKILEFISEEDIFEMVFGYKPEIGEFVVSPLRKDSNPGCWFNYSPNGKLKFVDFNSTIYINTTRLVNIDCFDAVQYYFKLKSFPETLQYIKNHFKNVQPKYSLKEKKVIGSNQSEVEILIEPRPFCLMDKYFWFDKYQIHKETLINDLVVPISHYKMLNTKAGDIVVKTKSITYCYTDFKSGNKKIYAPYENKKAKFLTNCRNNDIGGINNIDTTSNKIVLTKSYKDYRVLKNQNINCIWFQSESMFPSLELLLPICNRYKEVVIFFDNDNTGIEEGKRLANILDSYLNNKVRNVVIPTNNLKIKDPSDFIEKLGRNELLKFLNKKKLL